MDDLSNIFMPPMDQYVIFKSLLNNNVITYNDYTKQAFLSPELDDDTQKHLIFPIDNNQFLIVNKSSGRMMVDSYFIEPYGPSKLPYHYPTFEGNAGPYNSPTYPATSYNWILQNVENNILKIIILEFNYYLIARSSGVYFSPNDISPDSQFQVIPQETIKIPTKPPLETLETFPQYQNFTDNLPDETPKRLTGWTKIPCMMIKDHTLTQSKKLTMAPYYVIEKYEYWKKVNTVSLAPGESRNSTYTTGTNTTIQNSMEKSTNMIIGKDVGLKFNIAQDKNTFEGTAGYKQTITHNLDIKESTTTDTMTEYRESNEQRNPFDKQSMIFSVYQRATELRYIRPSQNQYDPDILIDSWTFIDDTKSNITSFPSQEAISAELNKKRYQINENELSNSYLKF